MSDVDVPRLDVLAQINHAVYPAFATLAGIQLGLFRALLAGPMSSQALAAALGVDEYKLKPLLYALVHARLLTMDGNSFANSAESAYYLNPESPHYVGAYYEGFWLATLKTADSVRTGAAQGRPQNDVELGHYFRTIGPGRGSYAIVKLFDFSVHQRVLDVGGGLGGVAIVLTEAYPQLEVTIAELPEAIPLTQTYLQSKAVSARIKCIAADVVQEPLAGSFDAAILSRFLHVLAPDQARQALRNIAQVLEPGGVIYIVSTLILNEDRISPSSAVYLSLALVNLDQGGQAHTEQEYTRWLLEAGFVDPIRVNDTTMTARKA
jgi:ubiquinone/menaquinone biosynthesis C-methylase UbiE